MKDPLFLLVQKLLKLNKISFDKNELEFQIKSHPSYPSLHAITGVLDHFNIENIALDVTINEAVLSQLPKSFLAQIDSNDSGKQFAVVENKGLNYDITINDKQRQNLSLSEFSEKFTGILVAVEKDEKQTVNTVKDNSLTKNSIVALTSLLLLVSIFVSAPNLNTILFLLFALIGTYISISILKQESGEESVLGNTFCSGENEKKNCDAVLTSKGANILKNFKLSDLSIIYFTGTSLATYLSIISKVDISVLYATTFLALPITIYSLYYQAVVVKKWCLLCLSIVAVLWSQVLVAAFNFEAIYLISFNSTLIVALAITLSLMTWNYISTLLKAKKEYNAIRLKYFKFKKNFGLFNALLEKSKPVDTSISNSSEIIFGNRSSKLNITLITNPFCGHCRAVHTLAENILKTHSDLVKITIRFNTSTENIDTNPIKVTSRLLEIYHTKGEKSCLEAMHQIYVGIEAEGWISKWGSCNDTSTYIKTLQAQNNWCKNNDINFTPEMLINGKSYPKEYDRNDLIYFIEDLEEDCCQEVTPKMSFI